MEEYSEDNAGFNQSWELANDSEYYARGNGQIQQWFSTEGPFQQDPYSPYQPNFHPQTQPIFHSPSFQNPYHNNQPYFPESDQNFFYHPDSFPNFQTPSYDSFPQFQNQKQLFYPQPHAQALTEHGYYPQSYPMEFQQEEQQVNDPQPPILSEDAAAFAAILEALKPNSEWFRQREEEEKEFIYVMQEAGFPWRNSEEAMEDNREEEEKEFTLADTQEWSLEVEEWKTGANKEQVRKEDELEQEEMKGSEEFSPCLSLHTEQKLPLQSELEMPSGVTQDTSLGREKVKEGEAELYLHLAELELPFPAALNRKIQQKEKEKQGKKLEKDDLLLPKEEEAIESACRECWLYLHSAQEHHAMQQQKESKKKKLEAVHCTLLEGEKEATIEELTCEDLDILVQEVDHLLQHSSSSKEQGEKDQFSPYSLQLQRIKEKDVEDFTWADFDFLLHEDNSIKAGQHQCKEKKQEEERRTAPCLQVNEAAELQIPQDTTPRHKEAAAYPSNANSFSFEFELTLNQFLLSLNVFISGDKLQTQQLNLITICKLQPKASFGDVHKKGTRGDGVLWNIKVHPP